jgi:hypothetical protein
MPRVEPEEGEHDLSQMTADEWIAYLFDRPVVRGAYWSANIESEIDWFEYSEPEKALSAMEEVFLRFREIGSIYSMQQINQGIWGLWGPDLDFQRLFFDSKNSWSARDRAIRAMVAPFRDYLAGNPAPTIENCFFMWWDLIGAKGRNGSDFEKVAQAYLETLQQILDLPDDRCQSAALHGLGHLDHPDRAAVVQGFIDRVPKAELTGEYRAWLEQCRDGLVM